MSYSGIFHGYFILTKVWYNSCLKAHLHWRTSVRISAGVPADIRRRTIMTRRKYHCLASDSRGCQADHRRISASLTEPLLKTKKTDHLSQYISHNTTLCNCVQCTVFWKTMHFPKNVRLLLYSAIVHKTLQPMQWFLHCVVF
jgi:hypothetical protein